MGSGRTRHLTISPGMAPETQKLIGELRVILTELDHRKPAITPSVFNHESFLPPARENAGRIVFVKQADGSLRIQYSDGNIWQTVLATAISFAVPAITYGTTAADGIASTTIRSDSRLAYPGALMSSASSTLVLTDDATDQTLTGNLGVLNIIPGTGIDIDFPASTAATLKIRANSTTAAAFLIAPSGQPTAGSRVLMSPNWFGASASDVFSAQTFRCWDAQFSAWVAGQITNCVIAPYDASIVTIAPSASSGGGNSLYVYRAASFAIQNTNATWAEVATAYFKGVRRSISSPTITVQAGVIIEPPTAATSDQTGLLIRQQTAQAAATNRFGIQIEAQNSGTNRYSIKALTDSAWLGGTIFDDNAKGKYGTGLDAEIYYDGTDLIIDPDAVGTGVVNITGGLRCDSIQNDTGLAAGVYTPTRSAEANLDSNVTMTEAQYLRVGNTVTVSGRFTADPTLTATTTSFELTLPVASNIGAAEDAAGVAFCGSIASQGAEIIGVAANDTAKVQWKATDITSQTWSYTFTYQVI